MVWVDTLPESLPAQHEGCAKADFLTDYNVVRVVTNRMTSSLSHLRAGLQSSCSNHMIQIPLPLGKN